MAKLKFLTIIVCFYINLLIVLPTVKAIRMTMEQKCHDTCCGKTAEEDGPNGCQKEKCLFSFNFNSVTFLVFDTHYQLQKIFLSPLTKEETYYNTTLVSNFSVAIWQPPEHIFVS